MRRERLLAIVHYLTALVLASKGVSYLQHQPPDWPMAALCLAAAVVVAIVILFHHAIEKRVPSAQGLIHLAEAAVCAVLAWHTHVEGKTGLPFAWGLAAAIFVGHGFWELTNRRDAHKTGT